MNHFFVENIAPSSDTFVLGEEESKHACRVLRLKNDDEIAILNGKGYRFIAKITDNNPKRCIVSIKEQYYEDAPKSHIHIAIAPTKSMDRLEWFIEKATEIGVDEITPIVGENSERKKIKPERLEKILIAAFKQSQRLYLPQLNPMVSVAEFINKTPRALFAHCDSEDNKVELSELDFSNKITIMIGPEGDFSRKEIDLALKKGFTPVSLGKNRLRTETAGIYATLVAKIKLK